jgi:hypothetical protein
MWLEFHLKLIFDVIFNVERLVCLSIKAQTTESARVAFELFANAQLDLGREGQEAKRNDASYFGKQTRIAQNELIRLLVAYVCAISHQKTRAFDIWLVV